MENSAAYTFAREAGSGCSVEGSPLPEPPPMMSRLQGLLEETDFAWLVGLIGEDEAGKLATLTGDLRRRACDSGDGKRIASGFSYLGAESAIAWTNACRDHLYPVMKESIDSFDRRWADIRTLLGGQPYHYVSLGPGDGRKDAVILNDLRRHSAGVCYVAVDMSTEMLRLGVQDVIRNIKFARSQILPVQLDFSVAAKVVELRRLLRTLFGEAPLLFSLLGNTISNFDDDAGVLDLLANSLLRPQDRFLLEVATTQELVAGLVPEACLEYERSRTFREFITSTLMHYTDLHIDMDSVLFRGSIEAGRAILVKIIYQNRTGRGMRIRLPDRTTASFPSQDTIRLFMTRKYAPGVLDSMLAAHGIRKLHGSHVDFFSAPGSHFGMDLVLVSSDRAAVAPGRSAADAIWHKE